MSNMYEPGDFSLATKWVNVTVAIVVILIVNNGLKLLIHLSTIWI